MALAAAARESGDEQTAQLASELKELLQKLDAEELTRKQVFDKLAEIEKKLAPQPRRDFEALKDALRKAGAELVKRSSPEKPA